MDPIGCRERHDDDGRFFLQARTERRGTTANGCRLLRRELLQLALRESAALLHARVGEMAEVAASNVHQADVDSLRAKNEDAQIELGDIEWQDNDSLATIEITVSDFLQMDTIGKVARLTENANFCLPMVKRDGRWMVRMGSPLRSETQSRD